MLRQTFRKGINPIKRFKLSILICSLPNRLDSLSKLLTELNRQSLAQKVEILYLGDNKSMSVGEKRNLLLYLSSGDYICFVDDDDEVSPQYISTILSNLQSETDVLSFNVMKRKEMPDGSTTEQLMVHSKKNFKNHTEQGVMKMIPGHLNVWRRELACRELFPEINLAEDHKWAEKLLPHIESEVKIEDVLYYYNDNKGMSETRRR